jgi:hypothetical protein
MHKFLILNIFIKNIVCALLFKVFIVIKFNYCETMIHFLNHLIKQLCSMDSNV